MFAPPKKGTGTQPPKKRQGTVKKLDVKALVKDFGESYRQLEDYVKQENEDQKNWNQHAVNNFTSNSRNGSTDEKNGKQSSQKISPTSSLAAKSKGSSPSKQGLRKTENIYADDTMEDKTDRSPIPEDVQSLMDAYPKKFQELRKIVDDMKERHAKSINRLRQKLRKDALMQEEKAREATKREAEAEADKLRHLLKVQRAKSQRTLEVMKIEKQKLVNSQSKSYKALRQTENKLADMQKGVFTLKKQLARSQREKVISEQDRVEQRSRAVKEKRRADEFQRDIKSLESGIEAVRLLNRQNENVTQHDYDVLQWKFRSIVKLVREVESIATPPDLGKTPSLQTIMEARNGRGSRVRLPAIDYPRRLHNGEQRAYNGRRQNRQMVYPQKKIVHQIPRRNNKNYPKTKSNKEAMLAIPMPETKPNDSRDGSSTSDSRSTHQTPSISSRLSEKHDSEREKSDDYASDFISENTSDSMDEKQNSRNEIEMLALPMPEARSEDSRENSSPSSTKRSRSTPGSASIQQAHSALSQKTAKSQSSRSDQSADTDDKKEKSDDISFDESSSKINGEHKSSSKTEDRKDKGTEQHEEGEDVSVFLT